MEYIYPAIFEPNSDGSFTIWYPDIPGCVSEGKDLPNALFMAKDVLKQRMEYNRDKGLPAPEIKTWRPALEAGGAFVQLVTAEIQDEKAVRRNVSVPADLAKRADKVGLSMSRVLQDALQQRLG